MYFFFICYGLWMKRMFKNKGFWFCILLISVVFSAYNAFAEKESTVQVRLGLVYEQHDAKAQAFYKILSGQEQVRVEVFNELSQMEERIITGQLECGYIVKKGFSKKIEKQEWEQIITLVKSPYAAADGLLNEMVYRAVIEVAGPYIPTGLLEDYLYIPAADIVFQLEESIQGYKENGGFVKQNKEYFQDGLPQKEFDFAGRIQYGLAGLFLFVFTLFNLPQLLDDRLVLVASPLKGRRRLAIEGAALAVLFTVGLLLGMVFLGVMHAAYVAVYQLALCLLGWLGCSFLKKSDMLYSLSLFFVLAWIFIFIFLFLI